MICRHSDTDKYISNNWHSLTYESLSILRLINVNHLKSSIPEFSEMFLTTFESFKY